jgi:hypothetical protein
MPYNQANGIIIREKKNYNWTLSKWFWYIVVIIILCSLIALMTYLSLQGIDFASRFLPTLLGLLITLAIFYVFFDLREELEWKTVRDRVMRRIGNQLHGVFEDVSELCEVNVPFDFERDDFKKYPEKKLNELVVKGIKLNDLWKDEEKSLWFADRFDRLWDALGTIETRHEKFLSPTLQDSLLNIEESLHALSFECHATDFNEENRKHFIIVHVGKIVKEIDKLRKSGIDVGF